MICITLSTSTVQENFTTTQSADHFQKRSHQNTNNFIRVRVSSLTRLNLSAIVRSIGLAEFYFSRGLQRLYTGTCIILQKTINWFLCLPIVFLKSKTHQLNLKDVIKLNRNLKKLNPILDGGGATPPAGLLNIAQKPLGLGS